MEFSNQTSTLEEPTNGIITLINAGQKLWQDRFWEETVKSNESLAAYIEYIHFNPIKHQYTDAPINWKYSSFHDFVLQGIYPVSWAIESSKSKQIKGSGFDD
jgi:hypothetical protein